MRKTTDEIETRLKQAEIRLDVFETALLALQDNVLKLIKVVDDISINMIKIRDLVLQTDTVKKLEEKKDDNGSKGMYR